MDGPKVLRRPLTPEIRESRERDMETVLDNYRENLRDQGVTDEAAIERFVSGERVKMQREYESLDQGDCSSNIYYTPTNWEGIASGMKEQEIEEEEEMSM
jgi:hypothetical protein